MMTQRTTISRYEASTKERRFARWIDTRSKAAGGNNSKEKSLCTIGWVDVVRLAFRSLRPFTANYSDVEMKRHASIVDKTISANASKHWYLLSGTAPGWKWTSWNLLKPYIVPLFGNISRNIGQLQKSSDSIPSYSFDRRDFITRFYSFFDRMRFKGRGLDNYIPDLCKFIFLRV